MSDGNAARKTHRGYWAANLRVVGILLSIWFVVGFVFSILLIEPLNRIQVGSVGLGFWLAQQGAIFTFVALVLAYALWMDRLDRQHGMRE